MGIPISTLKKITVAENMSGSKQDNIKDNVVRLRGLPFSATKADIERFFGEEYEIVKDGILLPLSADGRASGQAYVQFGNEDDATKAIEKKNKQIMGHRYIELYASSMEEAYRSSQKCRGENRSPKGAMSYNGMPNYNGKPITGLRYAYGRGYGPNGPPIKGQRDNSRYPTEYGQMNMFRGLNNSSYGMFDNASPFSQSLNYPFMNNIGGNDSSLVGLKGHRVQMRGLPYQVSERDIMSWFSTVVDPIHVRIIYSAVGKPTGDAEVLFANENDSKKAKTKHKQHLQHRYIELYDAGPVGSSSKSISWNIHPYQKGNREERDKFEAANNSMEQGWYTSGSPAGNNGYKASGSNAFPLGGPGSQYPDMGNYFGYYGYPNMMPMP